MDNNIPCYEIRRDLDLVFEEEKYTANHIAVENDQDLKRGCIIPDGIKKPDKVYFMANFATLEVTDYPANDLRWPIMSRKMLDTLLSVGEFAHKLIPVVMLDDTCMDAGDIIEGELKPNVPINTDYYAVEIPEFTDTIDLPRSEYIPRKRFPNKIGNVIKLAYKDMELPPFFVMRELLAHHFISTSAYEALQKNGIEGIEYLRGDTLSSLNLNNAATK